MKMGKLSREWQIYAVLNYLIAFALLAYLLLTAEGKAPLEVLFFGVLVFSLEFFGLQIKPLNLYSLSFPFLLTAIVVFGPAIASLLAIFTTITLDNVRRKTPWFLVALRACQFIIPTALAGLVYQLLGGVHSGSKLTDLLEQALPFLVAALVFSIAFNVLTALYRKIEGGEQSHKFISSQPELFVLAGSYLLLAIIGLLAVVTYVISGLTGFVWLVTPFIVAQHFISSYLENRQMYQSELESFISAIEEKQAATKEHAQRVADYALNIADQMGLADEQKSVLKEAALLHDIGMISVARKILGKPDRLTGEEFDQIKGHPGIGVNILKKIRAPEQIDRIVELHHERFDGTGYPEGLVGETIPLPARILTVADSFDAMVSPRPYRPAMTEKRAVQELKNFAATQFDPAVVDALAALMVPRLDWEKEITPTLFEEGQLQIDEEL